MRRAMLVVLRVAAYLLLALLLIAAAVLYTPPGRHLIRKVVVAVAAARIDGDIELDRIGGTLFGDLTLVGLRVSDSNGGAFLQVDTLRAAYRLSDLFDRRFVLRDIRIVNAFILLDRSAERGWNYARIMRLADTTADVPDSVPRPPALVTLAGATVAGVTVELRTPWEPDSALAPDAREAALQLALSDSGTFHVRRLDGVQMVQRYENLHGSLPSVRLSDPEVSGLLVDISELSGSVRLLRATPVSVTSASGTLHMSADTLHLRNLAVSTQSNRIRGDVTLGREDGTWLGRLESPALNAAEFAVLLPDGVRDLTASLTLDFRTGSSGSRFSLTGVHAALGRASLDGDAELSWGPAGPRRGSVTATLIADSVSAIEMERRFPQARIALPGMLSADVAVSGPVQGMRVSAGVTYREPGEPDAQVRLLGTVGYDEQLSFNRLSVLAEGVELALVRHFAPDFPLDGTVTGGAVVTGRMNDSISAELDVAVATDVGTSRFSGTALTATGNPRFYDVRLRLDPFHPAALQPLAPERTLDGSMVGELLLRGTLDSMQVGADLALLNGGTVALAGWGGLGGDAPRYSLVLSSESLDVQRLFPELATTSITAGATVTGTGIAPGSADLSVALSVREGVYGEQRIGESEIAGALRDGVAVVDSLLLRYSGVILSGRGTFGVTDSTTGTLALTAAADSLQLLREFIPADTATVHPRPARVAEAYRIARADSARIARATELERAIDARPPPPLALTLPPSIPRDSLSGSLSAEATVSGNISAQIVRGSATGRDLVALGTTAPLMHASFSVSHGGPDSLRASASLELIEPTIMGYDFDTVSASAEWTAPILAGRATVVRGAQERYSIAGDFRRGTDTTLISLSSLELRFDSSATWRLLSPALVAIADSSVALAGVDVSTGTGVIRAHGVWGSAPGDTLEVNIFQTEIAPIFSAVQSDLRLSGVLGASFVASNRSDGVATSGSAGLVDGSFADNPIPDIHATFSTANGTLAAQLMASLPMGAPFLVGAARVPLMASPSDTLARERPISGELVLRELPLQLVPNLLDQISDMTGSVAGEFTVSGTAARPIVQGDLRIDGGSTTLNALGIRVSDLNAHVTIDSDTLVVQRFSGRSGGVISLSGGVGLAEPGNPVFDLSLSAAEAYLLNDDRGRLRANADLYMRGPLQQASVGGSLRILNGVIYLPEYSEKVVLERDDARFLLVLDTTDVRSRELYEPPNQFMENLSVNVELDVARDTWVRSADANIELFSDGPFRISMGRHQRGLGLEGVLSTERGQYTFLSKRFEIVRGSATFIGEQAGVNPTLQITGDHEVQLPASGKVNISVNIGGTMLRPTVTLESDARPPLSQSDMLSYLAFGQSSGSLLQTGASGLAPDGGLQGVGKVAGQQLQGIALGTLLKELERQAEGAGMRSLGLDLLNITPAPTYTEIAKGDVLSFLRQTEFEAGRYVTPRTFVAGQLRLSATPGIRAVHRSPGGYRFEMSWEPRLLLREPTLRAQESITRRAFGLLLIREWRF